MLNRRFAAVLSLVLLVASVALAVVVGVQSFPSGLSVLACVAAALAAVWWALVRRGLARVVGAVLAAVLLVGAVVLVVLEGRVLADALVLAGLVVSVAAAGRAFAVHAQLPAGSPPARPVLFYNPKSGGGKAERFHVADEARARGVEPVELHLGDDLSALVRDAIANGADAVGVASGDGTQALVAALAAEQGLPYVCVPGSKVCALALAQAGECLAGRDASAVENLGGLHPADLGERHQDVDHLRALEPRGRVKQQRKGKPAVALGSAACYVALPASGARSGRQERRYAARCARP